MDDNFPEKLIKGRIVETIFQQMFLDTGRFNVYPFGYEQTLPHLSQTRQDANVHKIVEDIRQMPDFVMTPREIPGVYLVEVKYRRVLDIDKIRETSEKLYDRWKCPWIFVANQDNFYFDSCSEILNSNKIRELDAEKWVHNDLQEYYLSLLRKYIAVDR